jgi:hypothetical protein
VVYTFVLPFSDGYFWQLDVLIWSSTDGHLQTTFAWKLTNGALDSVSYTGGATELVETIAMTFQKMEFDATAGGKTVVTSFNGQTPIV